MESVNRDSLEMRPREKEILGCDVITADGGQSIRNFGYSENSFENTSPEGVQSLTNIHIHMYYKMIVRLDEPPTRLNKKK